MTVKISKGKAFGEIFAPPSKSMSHRYLICGALSGKSLVSGLSFSEDIKATLGCLEALGADIKIDGNTADIGGIDTQKDIKTELFCNESGSTLRFLIPICMLFGKKITLSGSERLFSRSLQVYETLCKEQGIEFIKNENSVTVCGKLTSGKYKVKGDISSQFISGLMFALPLLSGDSEIEIEGSFESSSYIDLTVKALADFGIEILRKNEKTFYIKGSQKYKSREIAVEGDYSNAAFFEALNILGGDIAIRGLKENSAQGDRVYKEIFPMLLKGTPEIDISDCPDLGPVLMATVAALNGAVFTGTRRLKIKESDRGFAMQSELAKLGCNTVIEENKITVFKADLKTPNVPVFGHNDHRIVMAMAVLLTLVSGEIDGAEAVSKSFPDFFEILSSLGIEVKKYETD